VGLSTGALLGNETTKTTGEKQRWVFRPIAALVVTAAALAGCSNNGCAYYGDADASTRCVVVGPSPIGGGQ
jgi:hypothetical protein